MESSMGSSSRRQGILMKPSYNNRNLINDDPSMSSLSSLPDMDSSNLNTIDEENPEEEQEVKSFLHRHDSHHDSDGDNDDDDDSNSSVDELKYRMQSKPENDESHTIFFLEIDYSKSIVLLVPPPPPVSPQWRLLPKGV